MKRSPELAPLSRDHHKALFVAQRLRRVEEKTAGEACREFLAYWRSHGRQHFRSEEEILLPAYAGHGDPGHPLVVRTLVDHVAIRRQADELEADASPPVEALRALGGAARRARPPRGARALSPHRGRAAGGRAPDGRRAARPRGGRVACA